MYRRIIILTALICSLAASAHAAQISVEPAYQEAFKRDTITVNITVYPEGSSVYAASYTLYFNKTLLNATSQTQGPFLSQDGESTNVFVNEINNTLGRIEYAESRMGTLVGVNGSGVLATITFHVIGEEGVSMLNISDLDGELLYSTAGPIQTDINNGSVEIREGICGDVTGEGTVNMGDVTKLLWNQTYWGQYPVDPWAADVTGGGGVNMGDVTKLLWNQTYWGQYPLCC